MNNFNINDINKNGHIHFIGIGGISMSGLAEILLGRGYKVSGSDMQQSNLTDKLKSLGATIYIGQKASNIKECDLIVYTAAIKEDNEEFIAAKKSGAPMVDRATLLGAVMRSYKYAVAVSGTHGKTSTTSMMSHIMLQAKLDPTISIGGELPAIDGNIRVGQSDHFVCEACEYCESFLKFFPYISIILNVEEDHLDYFSGIDHIISAFHKLALLPPSDGAVVANIDNENTVKAVRNINCELITCSVKSDADYCAKNIELNDLGFGSFDLYEKGKLLGNISLSVPGIHNVSNAVCAIATARRLAISFEDIKDGLLSYTGVKRRFETKGRKDGITVIDDYAHHPTEIKATLKTAEKIDCKSIWVAFQPHTYTRTKSLYNEFIDAFSSTRANILMLDIYAAREKDTGIVSSKQLAGDIDGCKYFPSFEACAEFLKENAGSGDLIITMGAGDIYKVGDIFLNS
ncbi:MAG: UDP-N-acetylmuramate--L-alanine ligase [Clostridia bacterium]|nr:UDP-N-acetylmuramate--L-alanine ligase [Clostridia bacterium]